MARPRTDISPRLVKAARARFLVDGVDGASLREIAKDAGTNIGMLYYYFATKDALFLAVVEEVYGPLSAAIAEAMAGDAPLAEKVERFYLRMARMTTDELTTMRLLIRELMVSNDRRGLMLERFMRGHIPTLLGAMMLAHGRGEIDARHHPAVVGISILLLGVMPQLIYRLVRPNLPPIVRPPEAEDVARMLAQVIMNGAAPSAPSPDGTRRARARTSRRTPPDPAPRTPGRAPRRR